MASQGSPLSSSPSPEAVWSAAFAEVGERIGPVFARAETRQRTQVYLRGLLSPVQRKNGWQLAEEAGEATPYAMQYLLDRARWQSERLRDSVRGYVCEQLGDPDAVLVIDETGFVKKGTKSVGVQRQYSGTAGRIENCQLGVFLSYASPKGHTLLDRELYLPKSWTQNPARCREADVPTEVGFATKPELAARMLWRTLDAGVPAAWVSGDTVYGSHRPLRAGLEARKLAYVLVFARQGTTLQAMVQVIGARWTVEQCFEVGKGEVGLDEYEVRSWQGWYRHITLCMLAQAFLSVLRAQSTNQEPEQASPEGKKQEHRPHPQDSPNSLSEFKRQRGLTSR